MRTGERRLLSRAHQARHTQEFLLGRGLSDIRGKFVLLFPAKGGVSLGVIAVLGGIIASLLRSVDSARERSRRDGDYRLNFYRNILGAYNELKAVRRGMRASGVLARPSGPLPAEQVSEIRAALFALNRVQLTFESSEREVQNQPDRYPKPEAVQQALHELEQYGAELIREWEDSGGALWPGVDGAVLAPFENLRSFLGESREGFEAKAAKQIRTITEALFPPP